MTQDPNSLDKELQDGKKPNLDDSKLGTEKKDTLNPIDPAGDPIDYEQKFKDSQKGAMELLDAKKKLEEEKAELEKKLGEQGNDPKVEIPKDQITEDLYPGFEQLDPEAKENLINYTNMVTKRATDTILKDPAITFARNQFNERKFDTALDLVIQKFPELKDSRDEIKVKYFNPSNVPNNIENILVDISKIHLFDKAKDIGAKEAKKEDDRIELERTTGGDKTPKASRTLSDWQRMAQENPAKFASLSKEYNEDLKSGKI